MWDIKLGMEVSRVADVARGKPNAMFVMGLSLGAVYFCVSGVAVFLSGVLLHFTLTKVSSKYRF